MDWLSSFKASLASPRLQMPRFHPQRLVAVVVGLVGALDGQAQVVGLLRGQLGQLDGQGMEVRPGDLFIELLGEHVHRHGVLAGVAPQLNLGEHLVGEGGGHDEAGVAHGATKVDKTALGQKDDVLPVLQGETVNLDRGNHVYGENEEFDLNDIFGEIDDFEIDDMYLGLDVGLGPAVLLQPLDLEEERIKIDPQS